VRAREAKILDATALRGEPGEHLGEGAVGRVVRGVLVGLGVPAFAQPRHHPLRDALGKDIKVGATRRAHRDDKGGCYITF
jgi:hypothetical protein